MSDMALYCALFCATIAAICLLGGKKYTLEQLQSNGVRAIGWAVLAIFWLALHIWRAK